MKESEAAMRKKMEEEAVMKKKLEDTEAAMKKMEDEVKALKKKELMAKRCASLAECGFEENEIQESLSAYDALDDEAFDSIVAMMKKKMAKKEDKEAEAGKMPPALKEALDKKKEKESKADEFDTTEEILEEVQETEALDLTVGGEDDSEANTTSAALIDFVYARLGKKLNKGE